MSTASHLPFARRLIPHPALFVAMASVALLILACAQTLAAPWGRGLGLQPFSSGLYSPGRLGAMRGGLSGPSYEHPSARRICIAWGRICVKAGQGTRTHPAPCGQWIYVCEKYA